VIADVVGCGSCLSASGPVGCGRGGGEHATRPTRVTNRAARTHGYVELTTGVGLG
jgi:hypothetical protein